MSTKQIEKSDAETWLDASLKAVEKRLINRLTDPVNFLRPTSLREQVIKYSFEIGIQHTKIDNTLRKLNALARSDSESYNQAVQNGDGPHKLAYGKEYKLVVKEMERPHFASDALAIARSRLNIEMKISVPRDEKVPISEETADQLRTITNIVGAVAVSLKSFNPEISKALLDANRSLLNTRIMGKTDLVQSPTYSKALEVLQRAHSAAKADTDKQLTQIGLNLSTSSVW